ncbi:MAG: sigma-54-dependent transcriptional regulator [Thermodesulfobacteriota bacterium]
MPRILVADDELSMREFLKILLESEGYETKLAASGTEALAMLGREPFDLLLSDIRMPDMDGLHLLEEARRVHQHLPIVLITAYASPEDAVHAMKDGAYDYITKPFKVQEIKNIVQAALSHRPPPAPKREAVAPVAGLIGESPEMVKIYDLIARVAPTQANVLITGESGTGKELVARAIHRLSPMASNEFVPITCSAIPESLFESEVFGHVKGAFTGATAGKIGLFELANNGTAFLDEIGELTPFIQTKLLRVLQERECKRVGATDTIKVNVRVISATNRNLEEEVMAGRFREDLFYRLAVVPIRIPPLRERKGDVPLLADYFLRKYSELFGKEVRSISSYAMEVLMEYDFPGNVRELENIIERGVALANSAIILPESLALAAHRKARTDAQPPAASDQATGLLTEEEILATGLEQSLEDIERRMIALALKRTGNSKTRAAELLKMSFRSLRYKVKKYQLDS